MSVAIHPQLLSDCEFLGKFPLCTLLLHKNAEVPWLILVPHTHHRDFLDLPSNLSIQALTECRIAANVIRSVFHLTKFNFASIGNLVPQLHLHVVGRHSNDDCWPKPVWGNLSSQRNYSREDLNVITRSVSTTSEFEGIPFEPHCEMTVQS